MSKNTPFRYDYVGSFLRPEQLKKARAEFEAGTITAEELKRAEDAAITDLVAKQKKAEYSYQSWTDQWNNHPEEMPARSGYRRR